MWDRTQSQNQNNVIDVYPALISPKYKTSKFQQESNYVNYELTTSKHKLIHKNTILPNTYISEFPSRVKSFFTISFTLDSYKESRLFFCKIKRLSNILLNKVARSWYQIWHLTSGSISNTIKQTKHVHLEGQITQKENLDICYITEYGDHIRKLGLTSRQFSYCI